MSDLTYTPPPVKGYTPLNEQQIVLANKGKELEEYCLRWLEEVEEYIRSQADGNERMRCRAEARTCIQTGFMWGIRALFAPKRVEFDSDNEPARG